MQHNTTSGGVAPYRFAVADGQIPPGTALDAATGQVGGTPIAAGSFSYVLRATDAAGESAAGAAVTGVIAKGNQAVSFTSPVPSGATIGGSGYVPVASAGSGLPVVFAVASGSAAICTIDAGMVRFTASGQCVVEARQPGDPNWNAAALAQQSFAVAPPPLTLTSPTSGSATVGIAFEQASATAGGAPPYRVTLASGELPPGMTIESGNATVSGVPLRAGTYSYRLQVTDANGANAMSAPIGMTVAKGAQTVAFSSQSPSPRIGDAAYVPVAAATSGLVVVLAVDPASAGICALAGGAVRFAGAGSCVLRAQQPGSDDWLPATAVEQSFVVRAATLAVTARAPATGRVGTSFVQESEASGGVPPYRFAVESGALPAGTTLDVTSGSVSGTPAVAGSFRYVLRVTDAAGESASSEFANAVLNGIQTIRFASSAPVDAIVGGTGYVPEALSGSGLLVEFAIAPASIGVCVLDAGAVRFTGDGQCVVEARQPGDSNWAAAAAVQQSFTVGLPPLTLTSAASGSARVGVPFQQASVIAGGVAPYRVSLASGELPAGLAIDASDGTVRGVPLRSGTFTYRLQVTDARGGNAVGVPTATTITKGMQTLSFTSQAPSPRVGDGAYIPVAAATSGLAAIFVVDPASAGVCAVSGGTVRFTSVGSCTIQAEQPGDGDWLPAMAAQQSFAVRAATLVLAARSPATARVGLGFVQESDVSGGVPPYRFTLESGALPPGTTLDASSGRVSGAPAAASAFTYSLRASDAEGASVTSAPIAGLVARGEQVLRFETAQPAAAMVGEGLYRPVAGATSGLPVRLTIEAGSAAVCSIADGAVRFDAVGDCSIAADQMGNADWDPAPHLVQAFRVAAARLTLSAGPVPAARMGLAFAQAHGATGGVPPYHFAVASGALPAGTALDETSGWVRGTTTAAGPFRFSLRVSDSAGNRADSSEIVGAVEKGEQQLSFAARPAGARIGGGYDPVATSSAGLPVTFAIGGTATCVLDGTRVRFVAAGACSVLAAQQGDADWNAAEAEQHFAIARAELALTLRSPEAATVGSAFSQSAEVAGGAPPYAFTLAAGSLPAGLAIDPATGTVAGTPAHGGDYAYTIAVRDGDGATANVEARGVVARGEQAIDFAVLADAALSAGRLPLAARPSSGLSASFASTTPAVCVADGTTLTLIAAGSCTVTASQAGNADWEPAVAVERSLTVRPNEKADQQLRFTSTPPIPARIGDSYAVAVAASSGLPVTMSVLPASATTCAIEGMSVRLVAPGTCVLLGDQAGDTAWNAAPQIRQSFDVRAAALALDVAPADGQVGAAFIQHAQVSGGAAPYRFGIVSGALPRGTLLDEASGEVRGMPLAAGPISYAVRVTDNSGDSATATVQGTVARGAQAIALGEIADVARSGTAPPLDGRASSGLAVTFTSYTPAVCGLSGSSVSLLAAGICTVEAAQPGDADWNAAPPVRRSFTITAPAIPVARDRDGVTVPFGSSGVVIDLSASIEGLFEGFVLAATPTNGTATLTGNVVRYVPASGFHGIDSFGFSATGAGGTSNIATVRLVVGTPDAPVAADRTGVGIAYESATEIDLAASIEGAIDALTIAAPSKHGTTQVAGRVVTYIPADDYSGPDSFGYVLSGPGGTSRVATVALMVGSPPPPVASAGDASVNSATSTAANGVAVIDLSALIAGEFDRIEIVAPPANGTVTLGNAARVRSVGKGGGRAVAAPVLAEYVPRPGFVGTDSFSFAASGVGGTSPPATVMVTVRGSRPSVAPLAAATGDGQTVSVDLTRGAGEGPFTAAEIVTVTPAGAAAASIFAPAPGAYRLDVTPSSRFGGTVAVGFTLSNAYGSSPGTVNVKVTARSDPSSDPNVRAVSDAQGEAVRRFARTQAGNFLRRAEQLHGNGGASAMGIRLNPRDSRAAARDMGHDDAGMALTRRMWIVSEGVETGTAVAAAGSGAAGPRTIGSMALWSSGAIDIGTMDRTSGRTKITATTSGLSAGADVLLADGVTLGAGGGYGNDLSDIGGGAAQVRGINRIVAGYASLVPVDGAFIDAMIGLGDLRFAARRPTDGGTASGRRGGRFSLGAVSAGIERNHAALQWALYGRAEFLEGELGSYVETGAGRENLRFDARAMHSLTASVGGRIEYRDRIGDMTISPRLRAEWSRELAAADVQALDYADIAADSLYRIDASGWARDQFSMVLGTRFDLPPGWSFDVEGGLRMSAAERAMLLRILLTLTF